MLGAEAAGSASARIRGEVPDVRPVEEQMNRIGAPPRPERASTRGRRVATIVALGTQGDLMPAPARPFLTTVIAALLVGALAGTGGGWIGVTRARAPRSRGARRR